MYFLDVRFLSSADTVQVKHTDYKTLKYENKKSQNESALLACKKSYCERRGQTWCASSKGPARLREPLRELEERLRDERTLVSEWRSPSLLCLVFSSGLVTYITLNPHTSDVTRIFFDRYCIGKIPANATGAIFTDTHLLFTFPENFTFLITFNASLDTAGLEKISRRDPRCQTIELYGASRKCEKRVSVRAGDAEAPRVLVWAAGGGGDLVPWSPAHRGQDRANVHVYGLHKSQMTLLCYHRIENEALSVEMSQLHENIVYTVEQKTYEKGGLSVECCRYRAQAGAWSERAASSVRAAAPVRAVCRAPCETRVLLACIDATVLVHDQAHHLTRAVKAGFIPSLVRWGAGLVVACEERGRLECFDVSLTPLAVCTPHDDAHFIDIGGHLKGQSSVVSLECGARRGGGDSGAQFLMCFDGGPLAILRVTLTDFVKRWLSEGQVARVIACLRALSWDAEGDLCLHILHATVNHLFRKPLSGAREQLLQDALGCFHQPATPLGPGARAEYAAAVHDLSRKLFHHLVRYGRTDKALSLCVELGDADLALDVAHAAARRGETALAEEARAFARRTHHDDGHDSTCSASCCSQCSSDSGSDRPSSLGDRSPDPERVPPRPVYHKVAPPLPYVPPSNNEPPLPVPVIPQEPAPVHSIRPNLHQYMNRDSTLWHDVKEYYYPYEMKPTHQVIDIIPRPGDDKILSLHYNNIYQTELQETNGTESNWKNVHKEKRPYKSVYSQKSAMVNHYLASDVGSSVLCFEKSLSGSRNSPPEPKASSSRAAEKNVKFSDTVTVAVVPEIPRKEKITGNISLESAPRVTDPRKELADSLPLCHPNHDYLRDFAPVTNGNLLAMHDYFEV